MAWVNGNSFDQINMMNCPKAITLIGDSNIPRDVGGNTFSNMQVQVNSYSDYAIHCEGGWNRFSGMWWDLHRQPVGTPAFIFSKTSRFNKIEGMHGYEQPRHMKDEGYMNVISSLTNHVPDNRKLFYTLPTPYKPNSLGNQDDYLTGGHLRGYTVTQVQTDEPDRNPTIIHDEGTSEETYEVGDYNALFNLDTSLGMFWDGTQANYDNPIVLEIDCTSDPIPMLGHLGFVSSYGAFPQGAMLSVYDGNSWFQHGDWLLGNEWNEVFVSPPWAVAEDIHKIRISFWDSNMPDGKIQISRIFAMSTTQPGNAFVQKSGDRIFGDLIFPEGKGISFEDENGNITPLEESTIQQSVLPPVIFDRNMVGDQDDVLCVTNNEYTFTQLSGAALDNGEN